MRQVIAKEKPCRVCLSTLSSKMGYWLEKLGRTAALALG